MTDSGPVLVVCAHPGPNLGLPADTYGEAYQRVFPLVTRTPA